MDRNIIACWWGARSVILDTVSPTGLPFDIFWPHILHEFIGVPEILLPVLIGCVDANLVEDLNQVVERHRTFGFICRRIPGKETNQYTKNIPNVLNQFQYQNFMKSFFEGSSEPISRPSFEDIVARDSCLSSRTGPVFLHIRPDIRIFSNMNCHFRMRNCA